MGVNKMLGLSLPRNAAILFLMSVGLSLSFLGCVQKNKTAPDVVTVQFSGEPATLDPTLAEDGLSLKILSNIMLGLYAYNDEGQLIPALSESVQISKDQKTYQFKIKSQALWSDGVPVKAEQFKLAIERALDPKSGSRLSGMISMIQKVEDHLDPQDQTLKITLKKPVGYFLSLLSLPITLPLRQDILDAHQGKIDFLLNPKLPTTGAYQIIEHQRDQKITLARNAWVTLTHPQSPREVILKIIQDESTASSLFLKGELDILGRVPDLEYERFIKEKKLKVFPMVGTFFLAFNLKKAPFNQVEVRRAVSVAIQREQVIRSFGIKSPTQTSKSSETPESHDALLKEKATLSWIPWGGGFMVADSPVERTPVVKIIFGWRGRFLGAFAISGPMSALWRAERFPLPLCAFTPLWRNLCPPCPWRGS
jgi:oligopeptide transport system substrate-binding protein